jgi:hypothetical protein
MELGISTFKLGDKVYSRMPEPYHGIITKYCLSLLYTAVLQPPFLTHSQAASDSLACGGILEMGGFHV